MWRLTLAQMRLSLGRLSAAGLAIVIGTAFVAATLIAGGVITRTSYNAVSASYADADLVVTAGSETDGFTQADLAALRRSAGVTAVDGASERSIELTAGTNHVYPRVTPVASDPSLEVQRLVSGVFPARTHEVALPGPLAKRLNLGLGDKVTNNAQVWKPDPAATGSKAGTATADPADPAATGSKAGTATADPAEPTETWGMVPEQLTVVGLLDDPAGAFAQSDGAVVVTAGDEARWATQENMGKPPTYSRAIVSLATSANVATATSALGSAAPKGTTIRTKDEEAKAIFSEATNGADVITMIVLGFAAVALLVAALVIANTFQVLIAQRTRTLALLRCVGADKRQLRRSVLQEAGLLGVASSSLGLLTGIGLAQGALSVLGRMNLDVPLPSVVSITPAVVIAPLLVGTLVTVLAAMAPARAATRVAPLAALRPADAPAFTRRRSLPRLLISAFMTIAGVALLGLAVSLGSGDELAALGMGLLGGALSFIGVLVGAVFWVPAVVGATGRLLAPTGMAARLAVANTVRNPRRTAATSTALLIGVTLVTMMSTGAASARATLDDALNSEFPVDVIISQNQSGGSASTGAASQVTPRLVGTIAAVPGVAQVIAQRDVTVQVSAKGQKSRVGATVINLADASALLRAPSMVAQLDDASVIVSSAAAPDIRKGLASGDVLTITPTSVGPDGVEVPRGKPVKLTAIVTDLPQGLLFTPKALARMGVDLPVNQVWARLSDVTEAGTVVPAIQDALSQTAVEISGAGVERAQYQRIIDTLLAIVVGMLGVAVLIALIGVANTLSLSVIERRRESATLRAIGMSRRQLRTMLAVEGMVIAGVGAVIGGVLGTLYGWAGAKTVLGSIGEVRLDVPWLDLGLVILVALAAGLLASVIPGRAAARTSPVAALAVD